MTIFLPINDGIDHINAYSKGKTQLGRLLSNFALTPFRHPELGDFDSMEGFWFYVKTGYEYEELRGMHGYDAKSYGTGLPSNQPSNFYVIIGEGIRCKLEQHPKIIELCEKNTLPYVHYYAKGDYDPAELDESEFIQILRKVITELTLFGE